MKNKLSMETAGYIASIFIGLILGLLGGGGSILSIPILVYLFNMDPVTASAYSLFVVGITSFIGAIPKYRDHFVDLKTGFAFGIPSLLTIFYTRKWIIPSIPDVIFYSENFTITRRLLLLGIFAILMMFASLAMIRGRTEEETVHRFSPFIIVQGMLIGFLTGLVGTGGGFLIIPALVFLTGLRFKVAVGTSLFIISINSLMGFLGDVLNYTIQWKFLLTITTLAIAGVVMGNFLSRRVPSGSLRKAFGWFTLAMGTWILLKEIFLM
jgi:uncharacterized membrane protein YfcA